MKLQAAADIYQIVRSVAKLTEMETRQQDTGLRLDLANELPRVLADAIMIEQLARAALRARLAQKRFRESGRGVLFHDPRRALGADDAALDGRIISATKSEETADKPT